MKFHRFAAIVVLLLSAVWVLTGEFSSVGSAAGTDDETPNTVASRQAEVENSEGRVLQAVSVARIPGFEHARSVRISGITQADKRTNLTARASGVILQLNVSQGDAVKAGDVLLTLAPEGRDAALESAEQSLEQSRIDFAAKEKLVKRGILPSQQLDQVRSALLAAESRVEASKAEMDRLNVVAAFDGIIDVLMVEQGGAVQPGTPVATLISLDPIIGVGEVNESDLTVVKVGNNASLRLVTGPTVDGTIRYISREAQPSTRTYTVEIEVPNPGFSIPSGMTTEVILRGKPVSATPVPRSIVTLNDLGELGVRSIDDEDKVVFHPIDIVDDSTDALILGGIPQDARVIVAGQNLVADGQVVKPVDADPDLVKRLVGEVRSQVEVQ